MRKKRLCEIFRTQNFYLNCFLICCCSFMFYTKANGQTDKILTVQFENVLIRTVLNDIEKKTGTNFVYDESNVSKTQRISLSIPNAPLKQVLETLCQKISMRYEVENQMILLLPLHKDTPELQKAKTIRGIVYDSKNQTLPGVTVLLKGTTTGVVTNEKGEFSILLPDPENAELIFSFVGMKTITEKCSLHPLNKDWIIVMTDDLQEMEEVVVTGVVDRKASSYTGSISSFKQEELMKAGNNNVINSLQLLEPSFIQVTDLAAGSNPNVMPTLELSGPSNFPDVTGQYTGNPNQPLFILNGFESSLQTIMDLDMNLVKSVTILKDASAKAIYGSKAANGVVIVETKQPEAGKLQVYYSGNLSLEVPDLTSYNLCNAAEKLEAEVYSEQVYTNTANPDIELELKTLYNERYREILRGVDTYWLAEPLRTGVGQKHSLSINGGDEVYLYGLNLSYNQISGAMKDSERTTLSGSVELGYRKKNLAVRNNLQLSQNHQEDPYFSFRDYAKLNPYWRKYEADGQPVYQFFGTNDYNPLWDEQWKTYNKTGYLQITNNFNIEWTILPAMRLTGRYNFTKNTTTSDAFYSPNLTRFLYTTNDEKGSYTKSQNERFSMGGDLNLTYSHVLNDKHIFFYNVGTSFQMSENESYAFTAVGFPDEADFLYFAKGFQSGSKPTAGESKERELSFLGIFNYSYDDRYMMDASLRTTGSSQFGRDRRWGNFWSIGLGWNVHNEDFVQNSVLANTIKLLKIRSSIGYSGSQNFNAYQALPVYEYFEDYYYGGNMGAYLKAFPNTELQWQSKYDKNIGFDMNLWNKLDITFNYYISTTKNSISQLTVAPSIGFSSYSENIGDIQNKGFDLKLNYRVLNIPGSRSYLNLVFNMASNKNEIKKISDSMRKYNEMLDAEKNEDPTLDPWNSDEKRNQFTRPSARYVEGQSLTAIWGARSAGIDPLTGYEVFIRSNGDRTMVWNANDQVVIGDSRPKVRGTFGLNMEWKGFIFNTLCSYELGGDYYNTTLVDKVENASIYDNVDKRYLTKRWREPGDVTRFKSIKIGTYTQPTSRFVMHNNQLVLSTINIGYDFRDWNFMKHLGASSLKITAYMNDVATFSSVKQERGTDYPFARNFNFSLSLNF